LADIVYNIKLQDGGQIEVGNRVFAATLGARFDTADLGKDPIHHEETSRHLLGLTGYALGYIHWALGTASVDQHGMPSPYKRTDPPSKIGTATLLDKEILEVILVSQEADQNWIDTLNMLRRVHSTWNHVARSICPEFTSDTPRTPNQEEKETWLSTFHREQEKAQQRIRNRRDRPEPVFAYVARNIFDNIRSYPANLDILTEAMTTLRWSIPQITEEDDDETELFVGSSHTNTLYSTLSRHTLRPTPYAAQNLGGQTQEHIAVTPRAVKVLNLDTLIIATLTQYTHCCPQHLQILLNSLRILTSAGHPNQKQEKDWLLTLQTAHILRTNLREFDSKDLIALGAKGEESLLTFVRTHLISKESRWMKNNLLKPGRRSELGSP